VVSFIAPVLGALLMTRALLFARAAGDPSRIAKAEAIDEVVRVQRGESGAGLADRLVRSCSSLAASARSCRSVSGNRTWAIFALAPAFAFFFEGRFRRCGDHVALALADTDAWVGVAYERTVARILAIEALAYTGPYDVLCRLQQEGLQSAQAIGDVYGAVNFRLGTPNLAWLIRDRPDMAESNAQAALQEWSREGFHVEHFHALVSLCLAKIYVGDRTGAGLVADSLSRQAKRSHLWGLPVYRFLAHYAIGAVRVFTAERGGGDRRKLLWEARRCARAIEREKPWMRPFARILRAAIALQTQTRDRAVRELETAADEFKAGGMHPWAAAAAERGARLRRSASSAHDIARAIDALRTSGVTAPERLIAMMAPGFGAGA
jgi:hypothetical protein